MNEEIINIPGMAKYLIHAYIYPMDKRMVYLSQSKIDIILEIKKLLKHHICDILLGRMDLELIILKTGNKKCIDILPHVLINISDFNGITFDENSQINSFTLNEFNLNNQYLNNLRPIDFNSNNINEVFSYVIRGMLLSLIDNSFQIPMDININSNELFKDIKNTYKNLRMSIEILIKPILEMNHENDTENISILNTKRKNIPKIIFNYDEIKQESDILTLIINLPQPINSFNLYYGYNFIKNDIF